MQQIQVPSTEKTRAEKSPMYTAILLDGTKNPVSIRLSRKERVGVEANYPPASITWSGSAVMPARTFAFAWDEFRYKGTLDEEEIRIYKLPSLRLDSKIWVGAPGQEKQVTVQEQGRQMVDEFLYPEKYRTSSIYS